MVFNKKYPGDSLRTETISYPCGSKANLYSKKIIHLEKSLLVQPLGFTSTDPIKKLFFSIKTREVKNESRQ